MEDQLRDLLKSKEKSAAKNYVVRNYKPKFNYTNMLFSSPMAYSSVASPSKSMTYFEPPTKNENRLNSLVS